MATDPASPTEFEFLRELRRQFLDGDGVEVGVGDDAAVVLSSEKTLVTTDMLVEGVHFDAALSSGSDVGYKAVAVNASDIAAMGGRPRYAVISLAVGPGPIRPMEIAAGVREAADEFGVSVVGGDTVAGPVSVISIAMLGEPGRSGAVLRNTARVGNLLCVTGDLGAAAAGLALLKDGGVSARRVLEEFPSLASAHRRGRARTREGPIAAGLATAMIDVSDGVGADAHHLAEESEIGLVLQSENVPVAAGVRDAASTLGVDPMQFVLEGGEDFELLIAVSPHDVGDLQDMLAPTPVTVIGAFEEGTRRSARMPDGSKRELRELGWDHFR